MLKELQQEQQEQIENEIDVSTEKSNPIFSEENDEATLDIEDSSDIKSNEDVTTEFIDIQTAAKMSDRSEKTIRNWIKNGSIQGKKEFPKVRTSKWLISKLSLMGYLATEVKAEPPRKQNKPNPVDALSEKHHSTEIEAGKPKSRVGEGIDLVNQQENEINDLQDKNQELLEGLRTVKQKLESRVGDLREKNHEIEILQLKLQQKDEVINVVKDSQPNLDTLISTYERKIADLQERLADTEQELAIVKDRYHQECSKSVLARIFSPPTKLKLLETK
jgi:hypothetical protein